MTYKQRILSEIEKKYNKWKLCNSAEAKYRCEAYKELIELIKPTREESVSEDLGECTSEIILEGTNFNKSWYAHPELAFKAGAKWQYEQFEKNRLAACDRQTKEEAKIEMNFVTNIIEKEHREPTYNDAIKYGMELKEQQMMNKAVDACVTGLRGYKEENEVDFTVMQERGDFSYAIEDEVKLIIIKQDCDEFKNCKKNM